MSLLIQKNELLKKNRSEVTKVTDCEPFLDFSFFLPIFKKKSHFTIFFSTNKMLKMANMSMLAYLHNTNMFFWKGKKLKDFFSKISIRSAEGAKIANFQKWSKWEIWSK